MEQKPNVRLAVLIDAENTSHLIAAQLFEEIAKLGDATIRRIYGDFSGPLQTGWTKALHEFAILPQQNFSMTTGKNASDISLVIDGMDILRSGRVDGFCLVTSDSDFTRFAARIREQGLMAFGFGSQKTPESLRKACHRFFYTELLSPSNSSHEAAALLPPTKAVPLLRRAVTETADEGGWAHLGEVGSLLQKLSSDFDPRNYGCAKLSTLFQKAGGFESRTEGKAIFVKLVARKKAASS